MIIIHSPLTKIAVPDADPHQTPLQAAYSGTVPDAIFDVGQPKYMIYIMNTYFFITKWDKWVPKEFYNTIFRVNYIFYKKL